MFYTEIIITTHIL